MRRPYFKRAENVRVILFLCNATVLLRGSLQFAIPKLCQRPGNRDVDNASWDCFGGRTFCLRPLKQSHGALSNSLLPGIQRNFAMANMHGGRCLQFFNNTSSISSLLEADYMNQASAASRADSCHEYFFQTIKEDLNQLKDPFASELNQFLF